MNAAEQVLKGLNPNALIGAEEGQVVAIEDVADPDGRMYRLEYRATPDGRRAVAWCLHNPWSAGGTPNAGQGYVEAHVGEDGFLCLGNGSERALARSPFNLDYAVKRARFWCTAFSVFMETGTFPTP